MKRYETLEEVVQYITKRHRYIKVPVSGVSGPSSKGGAYALKMLRKPNGKRIIFEEVKNFRIFDWVVHPDNVLCIDTIAVGMAFKGQHTISQSARLFLQDLAVINVYDHSAEFFSRSSIDFTYIEHSYAAQQQILHEWVRGDPGILRAQWLDPNDDIERLLEEFSIGRKISEVELGERVIDMDFEDF